MGSNQIESVIPLPLGSAYDCYDYLLKTQEIFCT